MNLFEIPEPAPKTTAQNRAENLIRGLNQNLKSRVEAHQAMFAAFWDSEDTPDANLAALNEIGGSGILLASAAENIEHIGRLAALVGKQVTDFLPLDQFQPRRAFMPHEDGTFTLATPAEGFDAWGKAIVDV